MHVVHPYACQRLAHHSRGVWGYFSSKKLSIVVLFDVLGGDAISKVAYVVRLMTVQWL